MRSSAIERTRALAARPRLRGRVRIGLIVAAFLMPVLFVPVTPVTWDFVWLASPGMQTLAVFAATFALLAYSLNMLMRFVSLASIAHGGLFGVGGYAAGVAMERLSVGFWPGLAFAAVAAAIIGLVVGALALRTVGLAFLIMTIALGDVLVMIFRNADGVTGGTLGLLVPTPSGPLPGLTLESHVGRYYVALTFLFAVIGAVWWMARSRFGQRLVAIRDNEMLARSLGLDAVRYKLGIFVMSAFVAGVAGHLYAIHVKAITPELFGPLAFIMVFLMVVMGGTWSLAGPAVGAWLVTFLPEWLGPAGLEDPTRQEFAFGVLLILFMLLAPKGLVGSLGAWARRLVPPEGPVPAAVGPPPAATPEAADAAVPAAIAPEMDPEPRATEEMAPSASVAASRGRPALVGEPILEVRDLAKSFNAVKAVDGVSFDVRKGEVIGVIGPNGSGKTTLVNCVSGFAAPSAGRVRWHDRDVTGQRADALARLGLVRTFQQPMVFPSYDARQHCEIVAGLRSSERPGDLELFGADDAGVDDILRFTALEGVADRPASDLSYGQVRRLGLASALAAGPEMLVLDEPGAGLTSFESDQLRERLLDLRDRGLTVLVIDHDMSFLMPMCDRIVVLDAGCKIAEGTPAEVQSDPAVIAAYLGDRFAERADLTTRAGAR